MSLYAFSADLLCHQLPGQHNAPLKISGLTIKKPIQQPLTKQKWHQTFYYKLTRTSLMKSTVSLELSSDGKQDLKRDTTFKTQHMKRPCSTQMKCWISA